MKRILIAIVLTIVVLPLRADEGMWLLALLKKYNAEALQKMGLAIPLEAITGEKEGSLTEAVISFGSGCTGSLISDKGLILTNYHCSYSAIQQIDNPTLDVSNNGYWAKSYKEELPISGLSITINKKILDITNEVKQRQTNTVNVKDAMNAVMAKYQKAYPKYRVVIKSYQNNTVFVLFLQLQYNDVRLVGLAPKNVAKFGGETDNWMWPRHSGDFAYFRVYADKNAMPAAYNTTNVPLVVKTWLKISQKGYQKGDFAMSMGYPAQSDRYATSSQVWEKVNALNPPMIAARQKMLTLLEEEMASSDRIRMQYAEKFSSMANYYKNAVGMNQWVEQLQIIHKKQQFEQGWQAWINRKEQQAAPYKTLLGLMDEKTRENALYKRALTYFTECFSGSCDMIQFLSAFGKSYENTAREISGRKADYLSTISAFYRRFNPAVDKRITVAMLQLIKDSLPASLLPSVFQEKQLHTSQAIEQYVDDVFARSVFADSAKLMAWVKKPQGDIKEDPGYLLAASINDKQREVFKIAVKNTDLINRETWKYKSTLADYSGTAWYPDADRTVRLSYGRISDLHVDNKFYPYFTTLSELVAKGNPHKKDFYLHPKLETIWKEKGFPDYGFNGDMPVCFITDGDVTGGNSGSPMLNAKGEMIGLVFDCNWESMTREFNYEKELHRVICADIRYVLLLTEKFSGTRRIINEIEKTNQQIL